MSEFDRKDVREYWHITMNGDPLCKTSAKGLEECHHAERGAAHTAAFNLRQQFPSLVVDVVDGDCPAHDWHLSIKEKPACEMPGYMGPCSATRKGYLEAWAETWKKAHPDDSVELEDGCCPHSSTFLHETARRRL